MLNFVADIHKVLCNYWWHTRWMGFLFV